MKERDKRAHALHRQAEQDNATLNAGGTLIEPLQTDVPEDNPVR